MPERKEARKLKASELEISFSDDEWDFETTDEVEPLDEIVGQPRALRALELGLGVRHPNYHIYAAGMTGTGRMEIIRQALLQRIDERPIPDDWLYLNNFDEPDRPIAVSLPAGSGIRFYRELDEFFNTLREALPKAFREEAFDREKERLQQQYQKRTEELFGELKRIADEAGLTVVQLPNGEMLFVPVKDGRPMTPEEVQQLSPEELKELEQRQQKVMQAASHVFREQQEVNRQLIADVRAVEREFAQRIIAPLIADLTQRYHQPKLQNWLQRLQGYIVDHLDRLRERPQEERTLLAMLQGPERNEFTAARQVNLLVDNSELTSAPVIVEDAPNYRNLFGTVERMVDRFGRVMTDFARIKAGSLHRANGGYLIFDLMDALREPFVWKELKRTLKSGQLEIELFDPFSMVAFSALKPEPIPLSVRIVALGDPLVYHLLYLYDPDFREVFRVKADFDDEMPRDEGIGPLYARFARRLSQTENLAPLDRSGVAELVRAGTRLCGDTRKVTTEFPRLADIVRESDFYARRDGKRVVSADHIRRAAEEKVYRSDLIAQRIRELIREGTLLIDVEGTVVGQVNGLAVANLGDYVFGRPSRITASVGVGATGLINIERESRLSGRTFDKAMLILEGYIRQTYARRRPIALAGSIAMEQNYGAIDGDSASVAELLALISALAELPLRQDIAVTGSVNQMGQVQAVGGTTQKVEGFFDVCRELGLTGSQGVCVPEANVENLILRPDVLEAIAQGRFHIWAVSHVDQALELLTGVPAGSIDDENSVHGRAFKRLTEMTAALKGEQAAGTERVLWVPGGPPPTPQDPRPPLPGQGA